MTDSSECKTGEASSVALSGNQDRPLHILFLDKMRKGGFRTFDFGNLEGLRGGERGLLLLAESLAKRGHQVEIASGGKTTNSTQRGVQFVDIGSARLRNYDVAISNNYASAFNGITAAIKIVWTRNPGFSWPHVKADFLAKLRHRPQIVHLSEYTRGRSWFLPRSGSTIIYHGLPDVLLANRIVRDQPPPPVAIFSSYAGRNLKMVVAAWRDIVHPALPQARLIVTTEVEPKHVCGLTASELEERNITVTGSLPWSKLMDDMHQVRLLVVPGHFQETFNNLVVEAAAAGVPTVTMGIGALAERVRHDETGWIAESVPQMGHAIVRALSDDDLWRRHHLGCLEHPDLVTWDDRAQMWEEFVGPLLGHSVAE